MINMKPYMSIDVSSCDVSQLLFFDHLQNSLN